MNNFVRRSLNGPVADLGASPAGGIGGTGDSRWAYFKKVVAVPTLSKTALQLDFSGMGNGDVCAFHTLRIRDERWTRRSPLALSIA